jgi:UDP-N-acetylglucosamine--N-acetylmuramyl-(pentapeptide) pyrophosphoryl-undecaprenol N-acetylglucosamine transferase
VKVLVAVGMTGGHIIPGIAVAQELKQRDSVCEVVFAGTTRGRAAELVKRAGYRYIPVPIRGWVGRGLCGRMLFVISLSVSLSEAFIAVLRERPCVIVGTGSFATLPFALSALLLSLPLVLLEQNVVPGQATRFLSRFATEVHVAYPESIGHLREQRRAFATGNPIRPILSGRSKETLLAEFNLLPDSRTILIFGGSSGARSINRAFAAGVKEMLCNKDVQFIVQTGEEDLDLVRRACLEARARAFVAPFIFEMDRAYGCADVVVCRAGATTIAELTGMGLASVLIPYPFSAGGHQKKNALLLGARGASVVLSDEDLSGEVLARTLVELLEDPDRLKTMRERASRLGRRDAAAKISESILKLCRKSCSGR